MRQPWISIKLAASMLAAGLVLAACGGGDASAPASALPTLSAQTITFAGPGNQTLGVAPPALSATASSGLAVTITSKTTSVCTVSGTTLTLVAAGTCTLDASQSGNTTYAAATDVVVSLTVAPALQTQTIAFTSPGNQTLGTAPPALVATATSGLAVAITSQTASVCTVSGTTLTLVSAGTCTLAANQAGNATYAAAAQQTVSFTVSSATVTALTFSSGFAAGNLTNEGGAYLGYGGSNLDGYSCSNPAWCGSGSGGSGATSYFYAYYQTPSPATGLYSGATVYAPGVKALNGTGDTAGGLQIAGQTTLNFTFNENPEWASSGTANFGVLLTLGKYYNVGSAASPAACNIKLLAVVAPLNGGAAAAYSLPLSSFAVIQGCNTGISTPAAALASAKVVAVDFQGDGGTAALPAVGGLTTGANLTVATGGVYPTTVALTGPITFGVSAALQAQAITFASPGNQTLGTAPPALVATSTSGLAVTITSTTASVCTVSGSTLTLVAAGSCSLTASQAGNSTYAAATPVTNTFTVAASGGGGSTLTFSSGFAAANLTNEGGAYFGYGGSNLDGYSCSNPAWCGSGSGGSGATSYFYAYYQTPSPATGLYSGASVLAPGVTAINASGDTTGGVQVAGQTTVNFTFNDNPEWASSGTSNFGVILTLGKYYNVGSAASPAACNIKLLSVVKILNNGAASAYSLPLSAFAVIQGCNTGISTPAAALASAKVVAVDFQGAGGTAALPAVGGLTTGANLTVATGGVYPTTVAITGGITFKP